MDQWASVKDFGATGDGVTDDTAALQAAIDATSSGSTLVFPEALTYLITSKLIVNKAINIESLPSSLVTFFSMTISCTFSLNVFVFLSRNFLPPP